MNDKENNITFKRWNKNENDNFLEKSKKSNNSKNQN